MHGHRPPFVKTAWVLIVLMVGAMASLQAIPIEVDESGQEEDLAGLVLVELQAEFILGHSVLTGTEGNVASSAVVLDTGTVHQRQRYMALMIGLGEFQAASRSALSMQSELASQGMEMTEKQAKTQEMLDILADGGTLPQDHESLEVPLGWFGSFVEADEQGRENIKSSASRKVALVISVVFMVSIAAVVGLVFLVVQIVRAVDQKIASGLGKPSSHHGVYAEVFALWLITINVLTVLAGILGILLAKDTPTLGMSFVLMAMFASLSVIGWAFVRGVSFNQILEDIGWHSGKGVVREVATGFIGYAMTLPIIGIGLLMTFMLMLLQQLMGGGGESDPFGGTGGGSHPIIIGIAEGGWQLRFILILLASVAAPVVEETVFRGVLYRHLRSSCSPFPQTASIVCSVLLVSFIFAAIHPQGWVAIPWLMGIAVGVNLLREWRGSIIPSMVVHGVSNGIVVSMMIVMLS